MRSASDRQEHNVVVFFYWTTSRFSTLQIFQPPALRHKKKKPQAHTSPFPHSVYLIRHDISHEIKWTRSSPNIMLTKTPGFPFRILSRSFGACGTKSRMENLGSRLTKTHGTVEMLPEKETILKHCTKIYCSRAVFCEQLPQSNNNQTLTQGLGMRLVCSTSHSLIFN